MSDNDKPLRVPACTNCARRKTKCDRDFPCANCVAAKLQCRYVQKPPEKKQRVSSLSRHEDSLTHISHQLDAISITLQTLVEKGETSDQHRPSSDGPQSAPLTVRTVGELSYGEEGVGSNNERAYEGKSSSTSQANRLADTSNLAALPNSVNAVDAQATAVDIVQELIRDAETANSTTYEEGLSQSTPCAFSQYPELADLSLPPMVPVLRLLELAKSSPQSYFVHIPHADEEDFAELCQKLYFPTRPFSVFAWINVNCGLYFLFRDLDKSYHNELQLTKSQATDIVATCFNNIDRAIKSVKLCVSPSSEVVEALICAAFINMESARGSLAWRLVSAAARMSIDLGFHRLPSGYGDKQRSRTRKLFWYVCSLDRTLSFKFGRSPSIQDGDVTTERPIYSEDFRSKWGMSFLGYIDFAKTQCDIYEQILSAKAQREPLEVRVRRVHECAAKISKIKDDYTAPMSQTDITSRGMTQTMPHSIDVAFSSILTLVYRMLPPDGPAHTQRLGNQDLHPLRFHTLCVESGRTALNALVCGWKIASTDPDEDVNKQFINWTILYIPFMPYIAVFSNQIATGDWEDLILLKNIVIIIETAAQSSSAMKRIYKAFAQLFRIAELWTSTSDSGDRSQTQNLTADIEMTAPTATESYASNWQDSGMPHQDWDVMFSEFDLGLGAENAREMMPWFEQHMNDFSTFS